MFEKVFDKNNYQVRKGKMVRYQGYNWEVIAIRNGRLKLSRTMGDFKTFEQDRVDPEDTEVW